MHYNLEEEVSEASLFQQFHFNINLCKNRKRIIIQDLEEFVHWLYKSNQINRKSKIDGTFLNIIHHIFHLIKYGSPN